jgi:hypothetical protein
MDCHTLRNVPHEDGFIQQVPFLKRVKEVPRGDDCIGVLQKTQSQFQADA